MNNPFISIFIPTYNDQKDLSGCLESLGGLNYPKHKIEIVVWDNASKDNTLYMVKKRYEEMEKEGWLNLALIEWHQNEGSYIPYNLVLPHLNPETQFILGLDADVELDENALQFLIEAAQGHRVAIVGARSVYFDKPYLTSHGAGFVDRLTARYREIDAREKIECDYVIGCCCLLSRAVFEKVGCFDPDFFTSHWEVDYCLRAIQNKYRIYYEPMAVAKHKIPVQAAPTPERIYYLYRNKLLMIKKNPAFFKVPTTSFISFGFSLGKLPFLLPAFKSPADIKAALTGLFDGIRGVSGPTFKRLRR